ncbi:hypothetical protein SAMN06265173_1302 [Thalassovita litoralis]|uniref:Glutathione import ATP-binding protein GsiA n=1 Tax=Thalassovita litoralis TaxID=1010611 RepID=A0A521FIA5_9RHOB|nr:hypothetical protein [Thalassovita litoralis]SMO95381.1 hypothetical protein SAMN06265173_1302 [Thalassovita litoralis]
MIQLFHDLREEHNLTILFITHDLRVAAEICDDVVVMKSGQVIAHGASETVLRQDTHPYIQELIDAIPGQDWFPIGGTTGADAATLFNYRQRMVAQLHNRVLATQASALYRQFYLVTSLITVDEDDSTTRMDRIVRTLQQFWSALADGDGATACQIMKEDAEFWSRDVAPRFAKIVEIEKK